MMKLQRLPNVMRRLEHGGERRHWQAGTAMILLAPRDIEKGFLTMRRFFVVVVAILCGGAVGAMLGLGASLVL